MSSHLPPDDAALPPPMPDDELVAYLDGELDAEAGQRVEQRLAADAAARSALRSLQASWDALDELDQADVGQDFTRTTLEMVAVGATKDAEKSQRMAPVRRRRRWLLLVTGVVAAGLLGFLTVAGLRLYANRQLVRDLPVLENLDAYRQVGDVQFLRMLSRDHLFDEDRPAAAMPTALSTPAQGDENAERRRARIEQMPPEAKEQLRRHQDRLAAMDPAEQARLRQLARDIDQDPQSAQLRGIAPNYHQWVSRQPAEVREELMELPPAERLERVKKILDAQRAEGTWRLPDKDADALRDWIRQYAEKNEKQIADDLRAAASREGLLKEGGLNRLLQNVGGAPRSQWLQWLAMARWREVARATGGPPLSPDELAELRGKLSVESRQLLEGQTPAEQWQVLHFWIWQLISQHFTGGGKVSGDDQLLYFFEHELTDAEREKLYSLPPDEMQKKLTEMYKAASMRQMGLQPGRNMARDFGPRAKRPPGGPFEGGRHPHGGKGMKREGGLLPPGPPPGSDPSDRPPPDGPPPEKP